MKQSELIQGMTVILAAKGCGSESCAVTSAQDASEVWMNFVAEEFFGASDLVKRSGWILVNGKQVARVSYNGRVWNMDGSEMEK
jgi:hypothetical protein